MWLFLFSCWRRCFRGCTVFCFIVFAFNTPKGLKRFHVAVLFCVFGICQLSVYFIFWFDVFAFDPLKFFRVVFSVLCVGKALYSFLLGSRERGLCWKKAVGFGGAQPLPLAGLLKWTLFFSLLLSLERFRAAFWKAFWSHKGRASSCLSENTFHSWVILFSSFLTPLSVFVWHCFRFSFVLSAVSFIHN